jgi:hypothetical protein
MGKKWTNSRNNVCEFQILDFRTADYYDQKFHNTNWQRLDTSRDASDFGVWINPAQYKIITFAEGGELVTECQDIDSFRAELQHMREVYNMFL